MLCSNDEQLFCIGSYRLEYGTLYSDVEYYNQCVQKVVALSSHFKSTNVIIVGKNIKSGNLTTKFKKITVSMLECGYKDAKWNSSVVDRLLMPGY